MKDSGAQQTGGFEASRGKRLETVKNCGGEQKPQQHPKVENPDVSARQISLLYLNDQPGDQQGGAEGGQS